MVASGAFLAIVGLALQIFSYYMNLGAIGLVTAFSIANMLTTAFLVVVFCAFKSQRELELFNWTRAAFSDLCEMISLFLKSIAAHFSIRLFVEVGTIAVGLLGENALAAQSILLRYAIIVPTGANGFLCTAVALMGRAAGAGKREKFFATFYATLTVYGVMSAFTLVVLFLFRYPLAYASTSLDSVRTYLVNLIPVVGLYSVLMVMWYGSNSLAYSLGLMNVPTFATVFAEFCIGIPMAMLLTFLTPLELLGFYIGIITSHLVKLAILWTYYACYWNDFPRPDFDSSNPSESSPLVSIPSPSSLSPIPLIDEADSKSLSDLKSPLSENISRRSSENNFAIFKESFRNSEENGAAAKPKAGIHELTAVKAKAPDDEPGTKPKK